MTQRIQRKRTRGWKAPANTLNATRPGAHGNPFPVVGGRVEESLHHFENHLASMEIGQPDIYAALIAEVRAANFIMCWCPLDKKCHCDIWIERANDAQ